MNKSFTDSENLLRLNGSKSFDRGPKTNTFFHETLPTDRNVHEMYLVSRARKIRT